MTRHYCSCIDEWVVRLVVRVQFDTVERLAAGFVANVAMYNVSSVFIHCQRVRERLVAGLKCERNLLHHGHIIIH